MLLAFKKFDEPLYKENDPIAKDAVRAYLERTGHHVYVPEENYSADIITLDYRRNGWVQNLYHEVEIKKVWTGQFRYSSVHIPFRKSRLAVQYGNRLYFWILRSDMRLAWKIRADEMKPERVKQIPNAKIEKHEFFYDIPIDSSGCRLIHLI